MNKSNISLIFLIILFSVFLFGCGIEKVYESPPVSDYSKMLNLINKARGNSRYCGDKFYPSAKKISLNEDLSKAAYRHSKDMSKNGFFNHRGSDGSYAGDRARRAGYNWRICGENILVGTEQEEKVVLKWLQSEDHCKIIMGEKFKEMGISEVIGDYKGFEASYWTLVMAAPF